MATWKLLFVLMAIGVATDASRRKATSGTLWAVGTVVAAPFVVPFWLTRRPLLSGERRVGGRAYGVAVRFAALWTLTMSIGAVELWMRTRGDPPEAFRRSVEFLGRGGLWGVYAAVWFLPVAAAAILAVFVRRGDVVEEGPPASDEAARPDYVLGGSGRRTDFRPPDPKSPRR